MYNDDTTVDITGMDKARVLCALYDATRPQGMRFLQYVPGDLSIEEAEGIIARGYEYFDYLKGRVLKVDISGNTFNARLYDRDNGYGAAHVAIEQLRQRLELERTEAERAT